MEKETNDCERNQCEVEVKGEGDEAYLGVRLSRIMGGPGFLPAPGVDDARLDVGDDGDGDDRAAIWEEESAVTSSSSAGLVVCVGSKVTEWWCVVVVLVVL